MAKVHLNECCNLEEYLEGVSTLKWKTNHNSRTFWEAYNQIKLNLKPIQENVATGAMAEGISACIETFRREIEEVKASGGDYDKILLDFLSSDHIIFLNDHGPAHIEKVIERAFSILNSTSSELTEFETFILLCAIQIHDIGNILGRAGHERKLHEIFDEHSKDIILDSPEKRVIKSIAMAHGGKTREGSKDTISKLRTSEVIFDTTIRTRFLAAVLRFADELADDSSRANRTALDLNVIGVESEMYHNYSKVLHTVAIEKDDTNNDHRIVLVYELESSMLKKKYKVGSGQKYLLDEIYDRTLKMEQERRYCMKFMHPYIDIGRIDVTINIYDEDLELLPSISYRLEDISYPDSPQIGHIKDVDASIPSGKEALSYIKDKGDESDD